MASSYNDHKKSPNSVYRSTYSGQHFAMLDARSDEAKKRHDNNENPECDEHNGRGLKQVRLVGNHKIYQLQNVLINEQPDSDGQQGQSCQLNTIIKSSQVKFIQQQTSWRPLTCCILDNIAKYIQNVLAFKSSNNRDVTNI